MELQFLAAFLSALLTSSSIHSTMAIGVLKVHRKFPVMGSGYKRSNIVALRTYDRNRHRRRLEAVDLPLGSPLGDGLYYTKIGIGTPAKQYYVQVDTGSDAFWVSCISCKGCPHKSDILSKLSFYDPRSSVSSKLVKCDDMFCSSSEYWSIQSKCNRSLLCPYFLSYADRSTTVGVFVNDLVHYHQLSGNGQTQTTNASVIFGCGLQQSGNFNSSYGALDGIIGFGDSNNTVLSQLAAAGKTKKIFSHCLDTINGGGMFAIGEVMEPKVKTTPIVANNWIYYNVNLKSIDVGGTALQLPITILETTNTTGTIIDSGSSLVYLPDIVYKELIVDSRFPKVSFQFENDLPLDVYPHDYLLEYEGKLYCVGFQDATNKQGGGLSLNIAISNKLVVYDIENKVIGWTEYTCKYQLIQL
uniref:Peptidase A1 domain-containing protein n=1 Tax=Leersia perrieri TaxID=77586 RepID=A0A0D9W3I3_9ORYZ